MVVAETDASFLWSAGARFVSEHTDVRGDGVMKDTGWGIQFPC